MSVKSLGSAFILIAALAASAGAAAPGLMTYQGRIKEAGLPVTGNRDVGIQICSAVTGGTCVDTGDQGVAVANGLFRTTFTIPASVAWETGTWYLEISVGGTAFSPRERLAAVPYAMYASSAATLIPNPGDASIFIASNVVIAGAGFSVGGATLAVAGGRVGVGTASPASTLEVNGTVTLSGAAHIHAVGGAPAPSVGDAGGGAASCTASTVAGSDGVGRITMAGAAGPCYLVFGTTWAGAAPVCFFQNETAGSAIFATVPTTISVTFGGVFAANDVISYLCMSY